MNQFKFKFTKRKEEKMLNKITGNQRKNILSLSFVATAVVGAMSNAIAQEYYQVKRLGTSNAVCKPGIETAEQLQSFFANNPEAVSAILADANWSGNAQDLFDAVAAGDFTEVSVPVGSRFQWMSAREKGAFVAKPYREWAGKAPVSAFEVKVVSEGQEHHIVIPKVCCNVSLVSSVELPDRSGFFIAPFIGTETRMRYEPAWDMDMKDSSGVHGIRFGMNKQFSENLDWFAQVAYLRRDGINEFNVYDKHSLSLDVGVDRYFKNNMFLGAGVGIWNLDDSDYDSASVFAHVGGQIGQSKNAQWFAEARVFEGDIDDIGDNNMLSVGIRYHFK